MALSPIEDSYLQRLTSSQFPDMPASEPAMPVDAAALDAPSMDGMQLAAGPSQTVSDAGPSIGPIPRNTFQTAVGKLGELIQSGAEKIDFDVIGLPGIGSMTLKDLTVGDLGKVLQDMSYGFMPVRGGNVATGGIGTFGLKADPAMELLNAAPAVVSVAKGAVKAAKATKGMPVGMSTQAVGGMDGVLTQTAKATAPVNDMGFYSAVEQAALNIQRKSGTGQAMLNDITKGQDVKLDEVKWIGLDDYLKGKKNVTKEEVQQYIAANKVDVQEVQLGGPDANVQRVALQEQRDQLASQVFQQEGSVVIDGQKLFNDELGYMLLDGTVKPEQLPADKIAAATKWVDVQSQLDNFTPESSSPSKFGKYTLPGGENYREILLTLPESFGAKPNKDGYIPLSAIGDAQYRSSHWDQPNVLAHIRVNDRVDADGKKMLLVEEVQSDWHQAGRDKGYRNDVDLQRKFDDLTKQHRAVVARRAEIVTDTDKADEYKSLAKQEQQLIDEMNKLHDTKQYGVPDAPMKDTWYQLALKRVLKYAADNGYERVGLTTGKTNAERFDLSKQVDEIAVPTVNSDGTRSVRIDPIEGSSIKLMVDADGVVKGYGPSSNQFTGKKLNEVVGKEMAEKIMAADKETKFTGLDLSVGGEGMKKYYDEVYPQFLAKYGKKWGAKVGETKINLQGDLEGFMPRKDMQVEPVRYIDITPEMRQGVGKGQPLFTATGIGAGTTGATMQDKEQK